MVNTPNYLSAETLSEQGIMVTAVSATDRQADLAVLDVATPSSTAPSTCTNRQIDGVTEMPV